MPNYIQPVPCAMPDKYRCLFKNLEGIIIAYEDLPVQTIDEPLNMGREMFAQRPHHSIFELCLTHQDHFLPLTVQVP
jgi:hypothetical protein